MVHKRLLSAIALMTLTATIVAFTVPSQAKKENVPAAGEISSDVFFAQEEGRGVLGNPGIVDDSVIGQAEELLPAAEEEAENALAEEEFVNSFSLPAVGAAATLGESGELVKNDANQEDAEEALTEASTTAGIPSDVINSLQNTGDTVSYNAYADVRDYIHVRSEASEYSAPIGKISDGAVLEVLGEEDGWYLIRSGNVNGYIRTKDCVTGEDAEEYLKHAAVISASTAEEAVVLRMGPDKKAAGTAILPIGEEVKFLADLSDWAMVETSEGTGFVYKPMLDISREYETALTLEEVSRQEKDQIRKEQEEKALQNVIYNCSNGQPTHFVPQTGGSKEGREVVEFAVQFVGNPYVMGGTSLTEGCDCSGFVMSVYKEFGFTLTHSTEIDQREGVAVESIETAEPGDIICYQGHVAIYMGDGMIVHAAGEAKGIRIAPACYTDIITIRRMFTD